jgi:hypothetical protein
MRWKRSVTPTVLKQLGTLIGIMWVIEDHLRPSGHIMPDHAGDRGAEHLVLAPHDHLHINQ